MDSKLSVINPDKIELELTVSMTLMDWKRLRDQLESSAYPAMSFKSEIMDMVSKAEKHFYAE